MMLQNFNIDGICTIASVLGQSVALDYYSRLLFPSNCKHYTFTPFFLVRLSTLRTFFLLFQVDELISEYTNVNIGLEESGTTYNFQNLLELLWRTRADADIVNWFGLYERSDVAWKEDSKYAHMFDHLCDEFKLTQRFADLDRKFKRVELNIWFVSDE